MSGDLVQLLSDLQEKQVLKMVRDKLEAGDDLTMILEDTRKAMTLIGKRFETGEYFLPQLIYSGEILKQITELIKPILKDNKDVNHSGKCIIGTVKGDIHDIGKDIVTFMLEANGFEVFDLGVDVPIQKFIEKIDDTGALIVGLSGFLTPAFDMMKRTIEAIKADRQNDRLKIMIGGGQINEMVREYTGADAYGKDAMAAVRLATKWTAREENNAL